MAAPKHIIHRQLIDIKVADKAEAQRWQSEFSAYYKNVVLPALEKACDELCPGQDHIRISKLELDLGNLRHDKLRPELAQYLVKQFREEILKVASEKLYLVKHGGAKTALPEGVAAMSGQSGSLYDTVMYYLEYGLLPWWSPAEQFSIRKAVDRLFAERNDQFLKKLRSLLPRKPWCLRIIELCTVQQLTQCLDPEGNHGVQRLYDDFKKIFKGRTQKYIFFKSLLWDAIPAPSGDGFVVNREKAVVSMLRGAGYAMDQPSTLQISTKAGTDSEFVKIIKVWQKENIHTESSSALVSDRKISDDTDSASSIGRSGRQNLVRTSEKGKAKDFKSSGIERQETKLAFLLHSEESIEITNAGVVLLWPYLQMFYRELKLVEKAAFVDENAQTRAVQLLHYLVNGETEAEEHEWVLFKLLCGLELTDFVPTTFEMTDREAEECENLLKAVIRNWSVLKNTSPEGLQKSFLRRSGLLKRDHNGWIVHIERIAIDVLIDRLSWPISVVRLPWNKNAIHVKW